VLLEKHAGFIQARKAVGATVNEFVKLGGQLIQKPARPRVNNSRISSVDLIGEKLESDMYIFCVGPWLPKVFPELSSYVQVSRQEVHYFAFKHEPPAFCSFVDWDPSDIFYGVWNHDGRGLKVAHDKRGPEIDPDTESRLPSFEELQASIEYLNRRFPGLTNSAITESRVCQYSNSKDGNFIIDRHPELDNCWIVGGGSGHGFKMGPAIGKITYEVATGQRKVIPTFRLAR
jgi:glycine/D-amino acid oxidase-like deaminating enzyme